MEYLKNPGKYPNITDFINNSGHLEIGYIFELQVAAIAFDEGGTVWEGRKNYTSLEDALDDAEQGIKRYIDENW